MRNKSAYLQAVFKFSFCPIDKTENFRKSSKIFRKSSHMSQKFRKLQKIVENVFKKLLAILDNFRTKPSQTVKNWNLEIDSEYKFVSKASEY